MKNDSNLKKLIDKAAPYWAGEREVFTTYWDSLKRSRESDRKWLFYQCSKEFWGTGLYPQDKGIFMGALEHLLEIFPNIDQTIDRDEVLDIVAIFSTEFSHYCAFANVYDQLALPGESKINPQMLKQSWKEDLQLAELRFSHKRENSILGIRAIRITEGGYCTLFSEGMKLVNHTESSNPHSQANKLIAAACSTVYHDEYSHMIKGIMGLEKEQLTMDEWAILERMTIEQLKSRILMRNSQFSHPLSKTRVREILEGKCQPIVFDYEKAETMGVVF